MVSSMCDGGLGGRTGVTEGARVQTSCSWGLQSAPALTLPLPEADIYAGGRETEGTLLWLNQVPVGEKRSSEISDEAGVKPNKPEKWKP